MEEVAVPWSRLAAFIRQHTHDVRNGLNSLDLETTLLQEILPPGEAKSGADRLKHQLSSLAQQMRSLSGRFHDATPIVGPLPASVLLTIWRERHAASPKAPEFQWSDQLGDANVRVDVEMLASVFQELTTNATLFFERGPAKVTASVSKDSVIFTLHEPKTKPVNPEHWSEPFLSTRHGAYGLGLTTAHRLLKANGGTLVQRYEPGERALISTITLPRL